MKIGDTVIIMTPGREFGKMCEVMEIAPCECKIDTPILLPIGVKLINPNDKFLNGAIEKWFWEHDLRVIQRL